jgi:hypothetical protein
MAFVLLKNIIMSCWKTLNFNKRIFILSKGRKNKEQHVMGMALQHQKQAEPLYKLIVVFMFILALICVLGGIFGIYLKAESNTEFTIMDFTLSTGHVGVAFMAIGIIIASGTMKSVLKNQKELAQLPKD